MRLVSRLLWLLPLVAVALPSAALAWGFDGHRRLAAHLHDALPQEHCVRQWLFSIDQSATFQNLATMLVSGPDATPAGAVLSVAVPDLYPTVSGALASVVATRVS